ncbi:MAG: hypothetical protein ACM37Z_21665, partial [Deltaproteobacteria bacterium]
MAFLLLQSSCGTQALTRWRRSEQPGQVEQAQTVTEAQPAPSAVARQGVETPSEIARQTIKPVPFPESVLAVPVSDTTSAQLKYDTVVFGRTFDSFSSGWQYRVNRNNQIVGFEF